MRYSFTFLFRRFRLLSLYVKKATTGQQFKLSAAPVIISLVATIYLIPAISNILRLPDHNISKAGQIMIWSDCGPLRNFPYWNIHITPAKSNNDAAFLFDIGLAYNYLYQHDDGSGYYNLQINEEIDTYIQNFDRKLREECANSQLIVYLSEIEKNHKTLSNGNFFDHTIQQIKTQAPQIKELGINSFSGANSNTYGPANYDDLNGIIEINVEAIIEPFLEALSGANITIFGFVWPDFLIQTEFGVKMADLRWMKLRPFLASEVNVSQGNSEMLENVHVSYLEEEPFSRGDRNWDFHLVTQKYPVTNKYKNIMPACSITWTASEGRFPVPQGSNGLVSSEVFYRDPPERFKAPSLISNPELKLPAFIGNEINGKPWAHTVISNFCYRPDDVWDFWHLTNDSTLTDNGLARLLNDTEFTELNPKDLFPNSYILFAKNAPYRTADGTTPSWNFDKISRRDYFERGLDATDHFRPTAFKQMIEDPYRHETKENLLFIYSLLLGIALTILVEELLLIWGYFVTRKQPREGQ